MLGGALGNSNFGAVFERGLENCRRREALARFPELQARVEAIAVLGRPQGGSATVAVSSLKRAKSAGLSRQVAIGVFGGHSRRLVANPDKVGAPQRCGTQRRDDTATTCVLRTASAVIEPPCFPCASQS
jgi:hypothetical protein